MTTHAKDSAELSRFFFVHYLGPGELLFKSGMAEEEVGPKKVPEMEFSQNYFHISGPQSINSSVRNSFPYT